MKVKSYHNTDIRSFIQEAPLFGRLEEQVRQLYKFNSQVPIYFYYQDEENEWISICGDSDLAVAFNHAKNTNNILRLRLVTDMKIDPTTFFQLPDTQRYVSQMVQSVVKSPYFDQVVQGMLPTVVQLVKQSENAPTFFQSTGSNYNSPPSYDGSQNVVNAPVSQSDKQATEELLKSLRKELECIQLTSSQFLEELEKPFEESTLDQETSDQMKEFESLGAPLSTSREEDDGFVIVSRATEISEEWDREGIIEKLTDMGFTDIKLMNKMINRYGPNIQTIANKLAARTPTH